MQELRVRRNKWLQMLALGTVPVALGGVIFSRGSERREMARLMQPVAGTQGLEQMAGAMWRSPHKVVCVLKDSGATGLVEIDTRTGQRKSLPPLPSEQSLPFTRAASVSPDGKWLLWPGGVGGWNARRLEGGPLIQRPRLSDNLSNLNVAWLPDSSGWVEAKENLVPTGDTLDGMTLVTNRSVLRVFKLGTARTRDIDISGASVGSVTVTRQNEAFINGGTGEGVEFLRVPLDRPGHSSITVTPPIRHAEAHIMMCQISPDGTRVAWTFQKQKSSPVTESIAVSDLDGSNFRKISPEMDKYGVMPTNLHWMPDGKRLSGWSGGHLVLIPTE